MLGTPEIGTWVAPIWHHKQFHMSGDTAYQINNTLPYGIQIAAVHGKVIIAKVENNNCSQYAATQSEWATAHELSWTIHV